MWSKKDNKYIIAIESPDLKPSRCDNLSPSLPLDVGFLHIQILLFIEGMTQTSHQGGREVHILKGVVLPRGAGLQKCCIHKVIVCFGEFLLRVWRLHHQPVDEIWSDKPVRLAEEVEIEGEKHVLSSLLSAINPHPCAS